MGERGGGLESTPVLNLFSSGHKKKRTKTSRVDRRLSLTQNTMNTHFSPLQKHCRIRSCASSLTLSGTVGTSLSISRRRIQTPVNQRPRNPNASQSAGAKSKRTPISVGQIKTSVNQRPPNPKGSQSAAPKSMPIRGGPVSRSPQPDRNIGREGGNK